MERAVGRGGWEEETVMLGWRFLACIGYISRPCIESFGVVP